MPDFEWTTVAGRDLADRYGDVRGGLEWRRLVGRLKQLSTLPQPLDVVFQVAFDEFVAEINSLGPEAERECRVFVSHRQADLYYAECIADLAVSEKYGYWLDVEDPVLIFLDGTPVPSPAKEILTAATIELGLLNATHIIAAMTARTAGSQLVPYEIGRAKQRLFFSSRSAVWVHPLEITLADCGDYVRLGVITGTSADITTWLRGARCQQLPQRSRECCTKFCRLPRPGYAQRSLPN